MFKLVAQQGDILLFLGNDALPKGLKPVKPQNGRHILAEGEATGHAHAITDLENCDLYVDEHGMLYLEVHSPVELMHEEHKTQTIVPGSYRVGRVREVDPFEAEIRQVAD